MESAFLDHITASHNQINNLHLSHPGFYEILSQAELIMM